VDVIVGTPGRVIDLIERRKLRLEAVRFAVLDEADQMLDMGFEQDMETILSDIPSERQTMLFSATLPSWVKKVARKYQKNPEVLDLVGEENTGKLADTIKLLIMQVGGRGWGGGVEEDWREGEGNEWSGWVLDGRKKGLGCRRGMDWSGEVMDWSNGVMERTIEGELRDACHPYCMHPNLPVPAMRMHPYQKGILNDWAWQKLREGVQGLSLVDCKGRWG
jgi:hypothetical protein